MKQKTQDRLYHIDRTAGKILLIDIIIAFVMMIPLCFDISNSYVWYVIGAIFVSCLFIRICLSPFVKSEEEEDFEKKVEYVLSQRLANEQKESENQRQKAIENYSPLCHLTEDDEKLVLKLLHDLPAHAEKPDTINLALIAQYLTALQKLDLADLTDKYRLRLWIEKITDKKTPNSSQFNDAIPSKAITKINKAKEDLENLLYL